MRHCESDFTKKLTEKRRDEVKSYEETLSEREREVVFH